MPDFYAIDRIPGSKVNKIDLHLDIDKYLLGR